MSKYIKMFNSLDEADGEKITTPALVNVKDSNYVLRVPSSVGTSAEIIKINDFIEYKSNKRIYYTSTDGNIFVPNLRNFSANIISNTYENGHGIITFDDDVTLIGDYEFNYCDSLETMIIPDSVLNMGGAIFTSCTKLTSVTLPSNITKIGNSTFSDCLSLTNVIGYENITLVEWAAFNNCINLPNEKGIYYVGDIAVYIPNNYDLDTFEFREGTRVISSYINMGEDSICRVFENKTIIIPESVKYINDYTFGGNTDMDGHTTTLRSCKIYLLCDISEVEYTAKSFGFAMDTSYKNTVYYPSTTPIVLFKKKYIAYSKYVTFLKITCTGNIDGTDISTLDPYKTYADNGYTTLYDEDNNQIDTSTVYPKEGDIYKTSI